MKKLLYITTNINNSGGVAKLLSVKLSYLVEHFDYDIYILNTNCPIDNLFYDFDRRIKVSSIEQSNNELLNTLKYSGRIKKEIDKINPDIIVNCDNGLKGALLHNIISSDANLIYESHISRDFHAENFINKVKWKLQSFLLSLNLKNYKVIVAYEHAKNDFGSQKVTSIPNPLLFEQPKVISKLDNKIAIAIGRLAFQKGYETMFLIWKKVIEKHPDWKLHVYGEGDNEKYQRLVKLNGLEDNIEIFKPRKDLSAVYQNASMLLNTSKYEPFGLAIIEAMSYGLPVFAFENTLGPRGYIDNKENGFLIEKDNIQHYAGEIISLIENPKEMKRLSGNAVKVVKKFDLDLIMKRWHDLFESL